MLWVMLVLTTVGVAVVDPDFAGPLMPAEGITDTFVRDTMEHFRAQKLIHRRVCPELFLCIGIGF
jgi:hypothetical protein